jgi:hypothetical protein
MRTKMLSIIMFYVFFLLTLWSQVWVGFAKTEPETEEIVITQSENFACSLTTSTKNGFHCKIINPINNLDGTCLNGTVTLFWERPDIDINLQYSGEPKDALAIGNEHTVACRWDAADLFDLGVEMGMSINSIAFSTSKPQGSVTYTLKIWQGGSWPYGPEEEIYSQELDASSLIQDEWNEISLDFPVVIDATKMLWIGYNCVGWGYLYSIDIENTAREGYSNCRRGFDFSKWVTLPPFCGNWCIKANVTSSKGYNIFLDNSSKVSTSKNKMRYDIYQDDEKIGETTSTSFSTDSIVGTHNFCVYAVYDSVTSDAVCMDILCELSTDGSHKIRDVIFYPNPTTGKLRMESGGLLIDNIEIFDIYSRKQKIESRKQHEIDISNLKAGIYFCMNIQSEDR